MGEGKAKTDGCERIDKWLWSTRMFKTRSQAAAACRRGQVILDDAEVKPSRILKIGDRLKGAVFLAVREELEENIAKPEAIDIGARKAFAFAKGPVEMMNAMPSDEVESLIRSVCL